MILLPLIQSFALVILVSLAMGRIAPLVQLGHTNPLLVLDLVHCVIPVTPKQRLLAIVHLALPTILPHAAAMLVTPAMEVIVAYVKLVPTNLTWVLGLVCPVPPVILKPMPVISVLQGLS